MGIIVAVSAFALLCWDAAVRVSETYPNLRRCLANPAKYAGREVWLIPGKVESSDPEGFVVIDPAGRVRVRSTARPAPGSHVYVRGVFEAAGTLDARRVEVNPHFVAERAGVILISLAVLGVFAWMFHKTFAWRDGAIQVR